MRFCLYKSLNAEYQLNILKTISSFLVDTNEDYYTRMTCYIEFTLTRRQHLGKVLIHRIKQSKISSFRNHTVRKLTRSDWVREFEAHTFFNVIKPINLISRLFIESSLWRKMRIDAIRNQYVQRNTENYLLV
jgi:hypothetical protein